MSSVPEEIYQEILSRLPVKSFLVFKSVCKNWYALISSSNFIKRHFDLTVQKNNPHLILKGVDEGRNVICSINYDKLSAYTNEFIDDVEELDYPFKSSGYSVGLLGSCNGLICLWLSDTFEMNLHCLWNPCTKEYKVIPNLPYEVSKEAEVDIYGFGYDNKLDDYKLIRGFYGDDQESYVVDVYTLGSNSWKTIEDIPYRFPFEETSRVLLNGALHWLGTKFPFQPSYRVLDTNGALHLDNQLQDISTAIISLDISDERFGDMQLPKDTLEKRHVCTCVGVLEKYLCVLVDDGSKLDVWVMQNYGVQESWTKRFAITTGFIRECLYLSVLWSFKKDELLLFTGGELFLYNLKHASSRRPLLRNLMLMGEAENYFESLVSLNSGMYVRNSG